MSETSTRCAEDSDSDPRDSLNSLLQNSEVGKSDCTTHCEPEKRRAYCCNSIAQCVWGVLMLIVSIGGPAVHSPRLDAVGETQHEARVPPYEWWADPPDEVKLRAYVFNVTNHDRYMKGLDSKLNVQELGPVVYLEKLLHSNITFNENSTLTYTAKRFAIFLPEENTLDLNATIIVPNLALLGISSYLSTAPYIAKLLFRGIAYKSDFFLEKTIYEYLWEYREPILDTSKSIAPGLVPVSNMGMLARIYADFTDEITVRIGPQWGHENFFKIDRFRGDQQLPGYNPEECPDRIFGSTEGVMYQQHITKKDVLLYWRKTVCKLMPLHFDSEVTVDNVPVYRFNLSERVFERTNGTDCYNTDPPLPAGLSDASKCYFNFPMVVSFPHFYTGGLPQDYYVTGLQPDRYKHNSYAIVEPIYRSCGGGHKYLNNASIIKLSACSDICDHLHSSDKSDGDCTVELYLSGQGRQLTGTPFRSVARMQSNLHLKDLSGFSDNYNKFSNLIIPLFWAEYNQEGLPKRIQGTIYFMTVVLPPMTTVVLTTTLLLACFIIFRQIYIHNFKNDSLNSVLQVQYNQNKVIASTKWFANEKEVFLKSPS